MKKIIIVTSIVILLAVLIFANTDRVSEGFDSKTTNVGPGGMSIRTTLDGTNVMFNDISDNPTATGFANSTYAVYLDNATKALMISKQVTPNKWTSIWNSKSSNPLWTGSSVYLSNNNKNVHLKINTAIIGSVPYDSSNLAKLVIKPNGDLVIKNGELQLWSLYAQELENATIATNEYNKFTSNLDQYVAKARLVDQLNNATQYLRNVDVASDYVESNSNIKLDSIYKSLTDIRANMDYELTELNGVANSKVNVSQMGLNSYMYVNLMATVLAMSLVVLIVTR